MAIRQRMQQPSASTLVPEWNVIDADGETLIQGMVKSYFESNNKISEILKHMFNSNHFKSQKVRYSRVKSPVELVIGTLRLAEEFDFPNIKIMKKYIPCKIGKLLGIVEAKFY